MSNTEHHLSLIGPLADHHPPILLEVRCRIIDLETVGLAQDIPQRFVGLPHWSLWESGSDGDVLEHRGRQLHVDRFQTVCIPPGTPFTYISRFSNVSTRLTFSLPDFNGDLAMEYFPGPVVMTRRTGSISTTSNGLTSLQAVARLQSFILSSMATLFDGLPAGSLFFRSHSGSDIAIVRPAIVYIHENIRGEISIDQLARFAGVTTDHFSKVFRRLIGKTAASYLRELRVSLAAERLRTSSDKIHQIAHSSGFINPSRFYRVFAQIMGVTPGRYRKMMRVKRVKGAVAASEG